MTASHDEKQAIRELVWSLLQREGAARFPGARGRIPNFRGAEDAARRFQAVVNGRSVRVLKADPTRRSCRCGRWPSRKASSSTWLSRLREPKPFIELDPARVTASARRAASIRGSAGAGRPIGLESMRRLDLVVCASVAVNRRGARIGKGGGYADVELGLATDAGLVGGDTVIVTTVHPLQILDAELPETRHDFRVDLLVTHDEVIRCRKARRAPGIIWDHLTSEKIEAIPALAARRTS